jgi:hypothetical protein
MKRKRAQESKQKKAGNKKGKKKTEEEEMDMLMFGDRNSGDEMETCDNNNEEGY